MIEESKKKQEATSQANVIGWNNLPNELQHMIIAHAVNADAWNAKKALTSLRLTSRHLRDLSEVQVLRQYKDNLDGGRRVSDAVIGSIKMDEKNILAKTTAVMTTLEFQSPTTRSTIFNKIAARKDVTGRMIGYAYIAKHADLFHEDELRSMDRDAQEAFGKGILENGVTYKEIWAAEVLARRYEDISDQARTALRIKLSRSRRLRATFADAIVIHNPSLLKDESFRSLVRADFVNLTHPNDAFVQLVPYIDKESRADTDFISAVFHHVVAKDATNKLLGYTYIAEHADLFQEHELRQMDRDALDTFREDIPHAASLNSISSAFKNYFAAAVLAIRYENIGADARAELQETLSSTKDRRYHKNFGDAVVTCNPSLLKHDSIRSLVRESFDVLRDQHEALAQLASYIDRNSRVDADFVVEASFRQFGGMSDDSEEHDLKASALDIAKFFDREIGPEHRDQIAELRQVDTPQGRALASAFEELKVEKRERGRSTKVSQKLLKKVEESQNASTQRDRLEGLGEVAQSNQMQMETSRKALMRTVRDRGPRGR